MNHIRMKLMTLIFYYQFTYLNQQQKYRTITYEIVKTEIIKKNIQKCVKR